MVQNECFAFPVTSYSDTQRSEKRVVQVGLPGRPSRRMMCGGIEHGPTLQLATPHVTTTKLRDRSQGVLTNAAELPIGQYESGEKKQVSSYLG